MCMHQAAPPNAAQPTDAQQRQLRGSQRTGAAPDNSGARAAAPLAIAVRRSTAAPRHTHPRHPGRCACRRRGCTARATAGRAVAASISFHPTAMHSGRQRWRQAARRWRRRREPQCGKHVAGSGGVHHHVGVSSASPHLLRVGRALELGKVGVGVDGAQEDGLELVHARIAARRRGERWVCVLSAGTRWHAGSAQAAIGHAGGAGRDGRRKSRRRRRRRRRRSGTGGGGGGGGGGWGMIST